MNPNMNMGSAFPKQEKQEPSLNDSNYISMVYGDKSPSWGTFTQEDEDYLKKLAQMSPEERDRERNEAQVTGDIRRQNLIKLDSIERSVDMQVEDAKREAKFGGYDAHSGH